MAGEGTPMKNHKTAVRIFCLVFAAMMVLSLFSTLIFALSYAA